MSLKQLNFEAIEKGNLNEAYSIIKSAFTSKGKENDLYYGIDAACRNKEFREEFEKALSKSWGSEIKITALDDTIVEANRKAYAEKSKDSNFDTSKTSVEPVIGTTVLPTIERLIRSTSLLSRVMTRQIADQSTYIQLYSYDTELDAAILGEVDAGSDQDDLIRKGDKLFADQKVQASMKMSELALKTLNASDLAIFLVRLARRVQSRLIIAILRNGETVANGTNRDSNIRGILNNYGTNGIGDATGAIGAISYATKAAADAAIVAAGGTASVDAYDLCLKAKSFLLPGNLEDVDENDYIFIGNRTSWGIVSTILDANGRAKARSATDPATGKAIKEIDGTQFVVVPKSYCPNDRVYLVPPKLYHLLIAGSLLNLNDGGLVELRKGVYSFVSRIWVNGSMEYAHKYLSDTDATMGTTAPDNNEQNAFRVFHLS